MKTTYKHTAHTPLPPIDKCILSCIGDTVSAKTADIVSATDYSPFGAPLAGRTWQAREYRFGYSGMEKVSEISGEGNHIDYGARIRDARIGPWLSVDPLQANYPFASPYNYALNKPIFFIDTDGRSVIPSTNFINSPYYPIYTRIISNPKIMPTANKYFKEFVGPKSPKNLELRYHNLQKSNDQGSDEFKKASSGSTSDLKRNITTFNSIGLFTPTTNIDPSDSYRYGHKMTELELVAVVLHELIVHSSKIPGISDATYGSNSAILNDLKKGIFEYANFSKIGVSEKEAAAFAYIDLKMDEIDVNTKFFKKYFKNTDEVESLIKAVIQRQKPIVMQSADERNELQNISNKNEKLLPAKEIIP